jgi:hypothetical protein
MINYQGHLILYGGLGCDKYITWAKLTLNPAKWELPDLKENSTYSKECTLYVYVDTPKAPIYGHTMGSHKNNAYIFGGMCAEEAVNDLTIINLKNMSFSQGERAPFRRR